MSSRTALPAPRTLHLASCLLLLAILLLAAGLRFYHLDWVEYKLDEANISRLALNMVRTGRVPIWGLGSSVGIYNGALSEWLLAIPYAVSSSPLVATGFVAALNVLAVAMTFAFTRKVAGPTAGLIAALLFAVAPWAVLNSRKLWAQDLLPPFVIAYLWTAYLALVEKKRWWLVGHVLALAACIQLHYSALTLVFLTVFLISLFWWRRWSWKVLAVVAVVGVLGFVPFLYLDATTIAPDAITGQAHAFPNVTRIMQTVLYRKAVVDTTAFQMAWIMVTGSDLHSLAGASEFRNYLDSLLPVAPVFIVLGVLVLVALAWALWRAAHAWNDARAKAGFIVAMGMVFPTLLFVWHSTPVFPHYFILLYPWPYVLVAMFVVWIAQQRPRWRVAWWGGALIIVITAAQIYGYVSIMQFVAGRNTPGGYGTPVGLTLQAVRSAEQMAREMKGHILVMADGDNVEADQVASIWDVLVDPVFAPRVVDRRRAMVYPTAPAALVYAPGASGGGSATHIPLRRGEGEYSLIRWAGDTAPSKVGNLSPRGPARWANGVQLLAAQLSGDVRPGSTFRWQLTWRVDSAPPPGVDYHWTNQLYDGAGKRVGQMDGVGFPSRSWRVGDTVVTWFDVPIAPDAAPGMYTMRVGMYTYPDIETVPVIDGSGYVKVGPVEVK
jgi:4-amino-4-deoxy-L-arabinose transferase-like glycosyltransferase